MVNECIKPIFQSVNPDALVLQCGVDGLAGDPCREFNISLKGYGTAVQSILKWCRPVRPIPGADHPEEVEGGLVSNIPVLMLGGGGYHSTNAARAWAYLTSIALNRPLDLSKDTVPDSCVYWETFYNDNAAGEGLDVPSHFSRKDENSEDDIREIVDRFKIYAAALTASNS